MAFCYCISISSLILPSAAFFKTVSVRILRNNGCTFYFLMNSSDNEESTESIELSKVFIRKFRRQCKIKNKICLHFHKIESTDMKKEENQKRNAVLKNEYYSRPRSRSPKAYWGCDTCKLKYVKSGCKLTVSGAAQDKNKVRQIPLEKDEKGVKIQKIKLTDLCDDDKKRIVELIEELSRIITKNKHLKEKLDQLEKDKQEQQDYVLRQANLFLEEKNFYLNEINEYKSKLETIEKEMKNKVSQWENHGREKDTEVTYFAKALQKSLREKNELHEQMNRLKVSLKHSLESFQKLKAELNELQFQEKQIRKYKSASCQTDKKANALKERVKHSEEDTEEEYLTTCNQGSVKARSSLDFINDKLEYVYRLLRRKGGSLPNPSSQKYDIDLSILLKNEKLGQQNYKQKKPGKRGLTEDDPPSEENTENEYKYLKPYEHCSRTSMQAERILKSVGKPLSLIVNGSTLTENNASNGQKPRGSARDNKCSTFLQINAVQKNNLFKSEDRLCAEDQILEDLFYSEKSVNLELDSKTKLESKDPNPDRPFTW